MGFSLLMRTLRGMKCRTATNITVNIVFMVVMMSIKGNIFRKLIAEKVDKLRIVGDFFRRTGAANMLVYAKYLVGSCHDNM